MSLQQVVTSNEYTHISKYRTNSEYPITYLSQEGVKFAIRGAGQQPLPGCANIKNGKTLDLSGLTDIEVQDGVISIGAGCRWGAVYDRLQEDGLAVTGARSGNNGIGGLALAGGLSFFGTREGFICDNVVNYQVVLASGEIVNANAQEHSDLFVAIRGGGNNFGVVTRFDIRTFKQGPFWGGAVFYFPDSFPGQIEALVDEVTKDDADVETHIMISLFFAAQFGRVMGLNQVYYTKEVGSPKVLEPFTGMQPQVEECNKMRMMSLKEAAAEQEAMAMTGVRCAYMNTTIRPDVATIKAASDIFSKALEQVKGFEGIVSSFTLQPYPKSLLQKTNKSDDETILATAKGVIEAIDKEAVAKGQDVAYKYLNYAFDFQNQIGSYGVKNKEMLQEVSRKYDSEGLFQKGVPGGFKLFT
ncbi:FAD-binding protein [Glarea lozoyensis ATCC 20868]|uniref:FAD-binding protein n=1 Tax=Glarea lozoyensis (strain ATCC 20868 / MF5171) TaxID=1116229 RepID=S3DRF1_GLAL2|nr:FAD-binding protein [Glarea lozoyensis ATCC 20868]EPE34586.1 FAD-binding protein [Glarea lozoyensis ATCC 20868]